nr:uncharacterized protein LOC133618800 isoform X2 [Nerophis lumbriciformis]
MSCKANRARTKELPKPKPDPWNRDRCLWSRGLSKTSSISSEMVCTWFRHWYTCVLPRSLCLVQSALSVHPCPVKNFAWNDPNLSRWGRILLRGLFSQDADGTPEARCRRLRKSGRYGSPRTTKADTRKFSGLMQILNTDQKVHSMSSQLQENIHR